MQVYILTETDSVGGAHIVCVSGEEDDVRMKYINAVRQYVSEAWNISLVDTHEYSMDDLKDMMTEHTDNTNSHADFEWSAHEFDPVSTEVATAVIEQAEKNLLGRYQAGTLVSEIDFLVGVMSAMSGIVSMGSDEEMFWAGAPPMWTIGALGNRSQVAAILKRDGNEEGAKLAQWRDDTFTRRHHMLDELVDFIKMVKKEAAALELRDQAEAILEELGETNE